MQDARTVRPTLTLDESSWWAAYGGSVIYGPCPGCDAWQIEVPYLMPLGEVEPLLAEHARECPPLAALVVQALSWR